MSLSQQWQREHSERHAKFYPKVELKVAPVAIVIPISEPEPDPGSLVWPSSVLVDVPVPEVIEAEPVTASSPADRRDPPEREEATLAASAMLLALKALSQRAIAAATTWFTLLTVGGAWYLWWSIPDPSPTQIVSLSIFAAFILAANWLVRRG